jgi:hypothetical protein
VFCHCCCSLSFFVVICVASLQFDIRGEVTQPLTPVLLRFPLPLFQQSCFFSFFFFSDLFSLCLCQQQRVPTVVHHLNASVEASCDIFSVFVSGGVGSGRERRYRVAQASEQPFSPSSSLFVSTFAGCELLIFWLMYFSVCQWT